MPKPATPMRHPIRLLTSPIVPKFIADYHRFVVVILTGYLIESRVLGRFSSFCCLSRPIGADSEAALPFNN